MPSLLARSLYCFYCGSKSAHRKDGKTRTFRCTKCEATNHLDEDGEITDPPAASSTPRTETFATALPRTTSPTADLPDETLFCNVCLKHQAFLTQCLANYLPPEDDANYAAYEAAYPQYRQDLEKRYPQVCLQCEPRVRERLKKTGYAAKSDVLTRALQRGPAVSVVSGTSGGAILLRLARFVWWASLIIQALWHVVGALGLLQEHKDLFTDSLNLRPRMVVGCIMNGAGAGRMERGCAASFARLVLNTLYCALAVIWYNPGMVARLQHTRTRQHSQRLGDFYRIQIVVFCVRSLVWWEIAMDDGFGDQASRATHGFTIVFLFATTVASHRLIFPPASPKIVFRDIDAPLIDRDSFQYPAEDFSSRASHLEPSSLLHGTSPSPRRPFPINNLAAGGRIDGRTKAENDTLRLPRMPMASPLTPPSDEETNAEGDATEMDYTPMDWEPVQPHQTHSAFGSSFQGSSSSNTAPSNSTFMAPSKSPFYGRLPPAPKSMEARLRNPAPTPQFRPVPPSKQADFFKKMGLGSSTLESSAPAASTRSSRVATRVNDPSLNSHSSYVTSIGGAGNDTMDLRPSQWTLRSDIDAATRGTGLEDMFSQSFQIGDGPGVVGTTQPLSGPPAKVAGVRKVDVNSNSLRSFLRLLMLPFLLGMTALVVASARDRKAGVWLQDLVQDVGARVRAFL